MIAALFTALLGAASFSSQASLDELTHSLRSERIEHMRARYLEADLTCREAALSILRRTRSAANPKGSELGLDVVDLAIQALDQARGGGSSPEEALAGALSLRVVPGAFEARDEGLGEATVVQVWRTRDVAIEGDQVLSLYWIGPGGEELRARREVMPMEFLRAGSLEMFIRPPVASPGPWQLACEVGVGEGAARGLAVRVDCVSDLARRRAALAELPVIKSRGQAPSDALEELCDRGLRPPVLGAGALLTLAEGGALGRLRPVMREGYLELHITPEREPVGTLVLVGGSSVSPLELSAGASASAWLDLAEHEGVRVILLELPLSERGGGLSLPTRIIELREERPEDRFHLVAFGDAAGFVPSMRARHPELPLDSVTLVSDSLRRGVRDPRLDLPTLLVECSGDATEPAWSREDDFSRVLIREPFVLSPLLVPELITAWNEAR